MLTSEVSSIVLEIPNDAYTTLSRNLGAVSIRFQLGDKHEIFATAKPCLK